MTDNNDDSEKRAWFMMSDDESVGVTPSVICHECEQQMAGDYNEDGEKVARCLECGRTAKVTTQIHWVKEQYDSHRVL